jgi:hypothetical protein
MPFFRLIQFCAGQAFVFLITALISIIIVNIETSAMKDHWEKLHPYYSSPASLWRLNLTLSVFLATNVGAFYFTGELTIFHLKL